METREAIELLEDIDVYYDVFNRGGILEATSEENDSTRPERYEFRLREYLGTADATWMFPRVASNVLLEAQEPVLTITPLLNIVRVSEGIRTVDYQAVGAIQAHEIPEGAPYPEEQATWVKGAKTAKVTKKGLKVPITDEMVADSLFDVVGMYMRAAGRAMARYKEKFALARFKEAAYVLYDNDDGAKESTTGKDSSFVDNGSLDYMDLMNAFGEMLASGRTPDTVIMHPLAWTMWANDPLFRNLSWFNSIPGTATGGVLSDATPSGSTFDRFIQMTVPFGLRVITSPYVDFDATTSKTTVYVIDSSDVGVITMREDLAVEQWDDPERDIISMKVRERYDITMLESEGYNIIALQNIVVTRNYGSEVTFTTDVTTP